MSDLKLFLPEEERICLEPRLVPATLADLKIADKEGRLIPLSLNPVQQELMARLGLDPNDPDPQIGGRRWRVRILKARREGMSTVLLALLFLDTYNHPHRRTLSIAHDLESAQAIFEIVHRFYQNLPPAKKREAQRSNRRELYWQEIDSRIFVATAGRDNVGSGSTLHHVHKSERAKWPLSLEEIRRLDASIDEAGSHANIVEETTAYGMNHFFVDWNEAVEGKSIYKPLFFPWFAHPDYQASVPAGFVRTPEEEKRAAAFGLKDAQLQWYREKTLERKALMPQEYPDTPEQAFLSSGAPYFDRALLNALNNRLKAEIYAPLRDLAFDRDRTPKLAQAYREGSLKIYVLPREGSDYVLTADTAEGLDPRKGDFDAAGVYDIWTRQKMASLYGKWDTTYYGKMLVELGYLYNTALLAPERNNHGWAVIAAIQAERYPDQRGRGASGLYHHDPNALGETRPTDAYTRKPGWPTLSNTKTFALDKLKTFVEDTEEEETLMHFFDRGVIGECLTFVHLGGGKAGGEGPAHDDRVSEASIAAAILSLRFERRSRVTDLEPVAPITLYGARGGRR